jgi:hypothetical protein
LVKIFFELFALFKPKNTKYHEKGSIIRIAALAVGVVVLTLGKKEKSSNNPKPSLYK